LNENLLPIDCGRQKERNRIADASQRQRQFKKSQEEQRRKKPRAINRKSQMRLGRAGGDGAGASFAFLPEAWYFFVAFSVRGT